MEIPPDTLRGYVKKWKYTKSVLVVVAAFIVLFFCFMFSFGGYAISYIFKSRSAYDFAEGVRSFSFLVLFFTVLAFIFYRLYPVSDYICPHCLKTIFFKEIAFTCPFCDKHFADLSIKLFEGCDCGEIIRHFGCPKCGAETDLDQYYRYDEVKKMRHEVDN